MRVYYSSYPTLFNILVFFIIAQATKKHNWYKPYLSYFYRTTPLFVPHMICAILFEFVKNYVSYYDSYASTFIPIHFKEVITFSATISFCNKRIYFERMVQLPGVISVIDINVLWYLSFGLWLLIQHDMILLLTRHYVCLQ